MCGVAGDVSTSQSQSQSQSQSKLQAKAKSHTQQSDIEVVRSDQKEKTHTESSVQVKVVEKHAKLSRSTAIDQAVEQTAENKAQVKLIGTELNKKSVVEQKETKTIVEDTKPKDSFETKQEIKHETKEETNRQLKQETKSDTKESIKVAKKFDHFAESEQKAGKPDNVTISEIVVSSPDSVNQYNQVKVDIDDKNLTITSIDTNIQPVIMHAGDNINALDMHTTQMPSINIQDADNNNDNDANSANPSKNDNLTPTPNNQIALNINRSPLHRLQTISIFNFGDKPGAPGQPPIPNLPDFLVPPHLITYETSIEINFRKIPPPKPASPPRFIKKMLVHTESLERRTRAFLSGNFEVGTTDSSLRTARQKIRSLKSTILKSDDEVKHAEDTINKAQSGDFISIFAPPIVEQPLYEFIKEPSQRSEDDLSENLDRRSERSQSVQQQDLENMEDYYSSKYSSRSSRRRVEGK